MVAGPLPGYGARLAYGCNIGAYFSGTVSGSLHGWLRLWLVAAFAENVISTRLRPLFGLEVERSRQTGCQSLPDRCKSDPSYIVCNWGYISPLHLRSGPLASQSRVFITVCLPLSIPFPIQSKGAGRRSASGKLLGQFSETPVSQGFSWIRT